MNTRDYFLLTKTTKIMKTGGTMNFLKRAGAILMVVAIFVSSCNKYADDFDQVNTKLDALATQVAGISQITTDMTALKSQITALQTAVAALPTATQQTAQFAAVTAQLTAMTTAIAAIDTQVKAVAATGTATKAVVDKLATDLAALSKKVTDDNATIIKNQATATAALAALDVKVTGLDTKMNDMAKTMTALSDAIAKVQAGVDANTAGIAGLVVKLNEQATAIAKIGTDLLANSTAATAANDAAVAAATQNATDNAKIMADQATILTKIADLQTAMALDAKTGTDADTTAALTIKGLQLMLQAQQAQLDLIIANTALKVTDVTVAGSALVGATLTASPVPSAATVTYQWSAGGTAIAGATSKTYVLTSAELTKVITVKATGTGSYLNSNATSVATAAVGAQIAITSIGNISSNTPQVGVELTAGAIVPAGATVSYQWQKAATITGAYTDIAGATSNKYKPANADATMFLKVIATGTGGYTGIVGSNATTSAVSATAVTTNQFSAVTGNNTVTLTLVGGTYVAGTPVAANFTLGGALSGISQTDWNDALFTRVSDTEITVQLRTNKVIADGSLNTITIASGAMTTQATSATAAASTKIGIAASFVDVTTAAYTMSTHFNTVKITVTNGTVKSGIVLTDLTIAGADAAFISAGAISNTSTVITISGITTGLSGATNTVLIKKEAFLTQNTATAAAVGSAVPGDVTSAVFTMAGQNSVVFTLTNGVVKSGVAQANLVFAGTDAATLAAGTVNYISATSFSVTGLPAGTVGTNNTVKILAAGQDAPTGTPVSIAGVPTVLPVAITSAVFNTVAGTNSITITLAAGGVFKAAPLATSDFTFTGTNAAALGAGTVTRISNTVATVTFATVVTAGSNTVTVKAPTMTTGAASVTGAPVTLTAVTSPAFTIGAVGNTTVTITLTGGVYKAGTIVAGDFTFTGTNNALYAAGTFTRTSDTVVTITLVAPGVAASANDVAVVKVGTLATQAASVAGVTL